MFILYQTVAAEDCLDAIKKYLIAMIESWNSDHPNLHAGIVSTVSSFDANKDYRYLSLRSPSNFDTTDSGAGTGLSTSSLPCRNEFPLVTASPLFSPPPNVGQPHKLPLQDSYKTLSEQIHRNSKTSLKTMSEVEDPNPHMTSNHQLTGHRERQINHPVIPHARSYVQPVLGDLIQRRTPAPLKVASKLGTWPYPIERQGSGISCDKLSNSQTSTTNQRSHTVVHRQIYPPPLPLRRHSDLASATTILSRFSSTLDDFNEDSKDDIYEDAEHCKTGLLDYITPKQHKYIESDSKSESTQGYIEGQPNIQPDPINTTALVSEPHPMETQESSTNCTNHHRSLVLLQRSHSAVHRPNHPPPLPLQRHSDLSLQTTTMSPTLDDFNEDEENDNYEDIETLRYITPRQHTVAKDKSETNQRQPIEGQPDIGKLQKKLWNRNSTFKKRKRPPVHKRSLTHSSDASSDDSDAPKNKPKPQRRMSSYHPPHRTSVVTPIRRRTVGAFPIFDLHNTKPKTTDANQCSTLPDQSNVNPDIAHTAATSEGDNEESEHNSGKHSKVRYMHLDYCLNVYLSL